MDFTISSGLDIPISGAPRPVLEAAGAVSHVALLADDYPGLRPSMEVRVGDQVAAGQALFTDKQNPGVNFTAPAAGVVSAINRGARRRLQSVVIALEGDQQQTFPVSGGEDRLAPAQIRQVLLDSGLWTALRSRPYGKVASPAATPAALFVTAIDTRPLAAPPAVVIAETPEDFRAGLQLLTALVPKTYLCTPPLAAGAASGQPPAIPVPSRAASPGGQPDVMAAPLPGEELPEITVARFAGPHPAGLPSTHIHFLEPVGPGKQVWQIGYQDVMAIGHLFRQGRLATSQVLALGGPGIKDPRLVRVVRGAALLELLRHELVAGAFPSVAPFASFEDHDPNDARGTEADAGAGVSLAGADVPGASPAAGTPHRLISGSVLDGHHAHGPFAFLGRYHQQVTALPEDDGSCLFGWLRPGGDRFSLVPAFLSVLRRRPFAMSTATWGGRRAIFPLGTYEKVMPLDIIATALLKSLASGNLERCLELGVLELVEEDLALCSFVCPGKNDFGPMLREMLSRIEEEG
ncbi:NADH:ubiquinone reductase (Na(+)-transporting) subunit A [Desulfurivibrio dismutans]|uniref:NADH:ubiquinone reductase (Na(+)-transporting) subunit A n=1 Tax=Desulfurivibrio dismutans TaxID=1398908 RepID=UPI0023DC13B3|nr:NADH:ubiquinone reductase (Na(+)-transporting) subunit A [Desulfurivibrio alkaliphilus]MDF1614176.1 NADH:ubiquinone reductase (Na(+)-transporting) subunit A [Desulfurivibrio alkaliphilus]